MIKVLIPSDADFRIYENPLRLLYEKKQEKICDESCFEFIRDNTFFYLFLDDEKIIGVIYYFIDDSNRLFLNAFSERKMYPKNVECLKLSTSWFNVDIFAEAQNRASALCLLKAGFCRVKNNLFQYSKIKTVI